MTTLFHVQYTKVNALDKIQPFKCLFSEDIRHIKLFDVSMKLEQCLNAVREIYFRFAREHQFNFLQA